MNITKIKLLWILIVLQEVQGTETKCNVQNTNVDCRHLTLTIVPSHLPVQVTSIDLSRNSIQMVKIFTFQYFKNLTELNLGYNLIQSIDKNAFHGLHSLQSLHLEHNFLQVLPIGMFDNLICLQHLWIYHNKLQNHPDDQMKETSKILSMRTLSFDIHQDFKFPSKWSTLSNLTHVEIFPKSAKVQFNKEMFAHIKIIPIMSLYLDVVPSISEDFFYHFPKLDSITLDLGASVPTNPINETLKASGSLLGQGFVNTANAGSFLSETLRIRDLNLSSNKITTIPKGFFMHQFEHLSSLNMSHNNLTIFPKFHSTVKTLNLIDLTFNSITHFVDTDIDQIEKLGEVDLLLKGNPFQCSCKTLQFLKWLSKSKRILDILDVKCVTDTASRTFMFEIISDLKQFEISCRTKFWLPFAVSLTSIIIFAMILIVIFFRYKYAFEYFLLRLKMNMKNYKDLRQEYTYDAFISYSHADVEWVKRFHDKLSSMGFELCLDAKDFIAGNSIAENVINAIDSSRKVIFIITHNFLKSNWGSYEIEMTRMHAFQKGRKDMVIIVVKDEIEVNEMPHVMKEMWFKIICIQ
ncbi:unnamed protein product [Mytilus coruscus]|uniref:TIR domain-containing protein n=1 Tax=Mytilus coruscus TaxID=42192 RepID=A0A6J8CVR2_MYTCO|nr:unnamed protein product [Mytilus coruscus]